MINRPLGSGEMAPTDGNEMLAVDHRMQHVMLPQAVWSAISR